VDEGLDLPPLDELPAEAACAERLQTCGNHQRLTFPGIAEAPAVGARCRQRRSPVAVVKLENMKLTPGPYFPQRSSKTKLYADCLQGQGG